MHKIASNITMGILIASVIILLPLSAASAEGKDRPVTPYGDFCPACSNYGFCKYQMNHDEAEKALIDYYQKKDLNVQIERSRGRFIKAVIHTNGNIVDIIIFDRRTGRIRSIY